MRESELTLRACILGVLIVVVFTAANVYLGLRVVITIASSIPAAVISMSPVVLGAVIGWLCNAYIAGRPDAAMLARFGVLLASGLIVGESLLGVVNEGLIVAANNATPLALVGGEFGPMANVIGPVLFAVFIVASYAWVSRQARA